MFQAVGTGGLSGITSLTYVLSSATQLSAIQYFGGWTDDGRCSANFTVSYSTDNGATFTALIDPTGGFYQTYGDPGPDIQVGGMSGNTPFGIATFARQNGGQGPDANYVSITDTTGLIGGGALITDLQFTFGVGPEGNGWDGLQQLTAIAAVPEPGVCVLFGVGLASLVGLRKRKVA